MSPLFLSIALLFLAPLLHVLSIRKDFVFASLNGFVFVLIAALIGLEILPHLIEDAGPAVFLFVLLGLALPALTEKTFHKTASVHKVAVWLGVTGLMIHTMVDGATLALEPAESGLSLGVVLHRVPIGLFVWWFIRPYFGSLMAWITLALIAAGTLTGFAFAENVVGPVETAAVVYFQAFVAGTLIHILFHKPPVMQSNTERKSLNQRAEGLGNLLGLLSAVYLLTDDHGHASEVTWLSEMSDTLLYLTLETAPMLLLAFLLAGVIKAFMPDTFVSWLKHGSSFRQAGKGMAVGIPLPLCSCSVVPVYHSLITKGVPKSAAMAFLIATPEIGIDALLISLPLLGGEMTLARLIGAALLAFIVALVVSAFSQRDPHEHAHSHHEHTTALTFANRLKRGMHYSLHDMLDHIAPWIVVGLVIAAVIQPFMGDLNLAAVPGGAQVLMFAALGIPVYVCAASATPLVAIFLINGVSPGAGLAFLLAGPATNVTTFGVLARLHDRKTAWLLAVSCFTTAVVLGWVTNLALPDFTPVELASDHHHAGPLGWIALFALIGLFGYSVFRRGLRAFFLELVTQHDHTGGDDCGHSHCSHHSH